MKEKSKCKNKEGNGTTDGVKDESLVTGCVFINKKADRVKNHC